MKQKKALRLGFDVAMDKGSTWRPLKVQFWNQESDFKKFSPAEPFKYMGDALTALSLVKLNHYIKSPIASPHVDYAMACEAWKALDPHIELYERSQERVRALQAHLAVVAPHHCAEFEENFNESFEHAMKPWGVDLPALCHLIETIASFEKKVGSPLLYNFGLNFSKPFMDKLHSLYSFLHNLRSIVAIDHNAHVVDHSHEGVKMDPISDYLPRSEYIVNDALIYWNFKKLSAPFRGPKTPDTRVDKLFATPFEKTLQKYVHHACQLLDNLPPSFVNSLNPVELEEALHLVQMDWLLGAPAGLLFKIREELFGVQSGYEKIFWKDEQPKPHSKIFSLHLCCEISDELIYGKKAG